MGNMSLKINRFDHIAIEVKNLKQAIQFYVEILGIEELPTPDSIKQKGVRWLKLDKNIPLHLVENKMATPPKTAHIAINVDDLQSWKEFLTEHGIETQQPKFDLYDAVRFFFFDPSGNRIEFIKWLK